MGETHGADLYEGGGEARSEGPTQREYPRGGLANFREPRPLDKESSIIGGGHIHFRRLTNTGRVARTWCGRCDRLVASVAIWRTSKLKVKNAGAMPQVPDVRAKASARKCGLLAAR